MTQLQQALRRQCLSAVEVPPPPAGVLHERREAGWVRLDLHRHRRRPSRPRLSSRGRNG